MDAFIPLGLVGLIYDSINNPEAQQEFLVKFAARLHASSAFSFICSPDGKQRHVRAAVGMDSKWWPLFNEYYIHLDPYWLGGTMRSRYPLGIPTIGEQRVPNDELVHMAFYNDFMRPQNHFHSASLRAREDFIMVLARSQRSGAFDSEEMELFGYIAPHFVRAAQIQLQIESLKHVAHHEPLNLTPLITKLHLTAAEAQLAAALFRGDSAAGYARATHRSINTVRWTVKCIYAKTGVHRQNELIKIIARALA
jgi:DNA-binding CsgD family transcriptional regulator